MVEISLRRWERVLERVDQGINSYVFLALVFATLFIVPVLPGGWQAAVNKILLTGIVFSLVLSIRRHQDRILPIVVLAIAVEWLTGAIEASLLNLISRVLNMGLFLFALHQMVRRIARSRLVTGKVIVDAISGYLLIGLFFTVANRFLVGLLPGALNLPQETASLGEITYYSLITLATVGYGDITPAIPAARSLATLAAVAGPMYIAVIIAMLVGKFQTEEQKN